MSDCCSVNAKTGTAPLVMRCPLNGARSRKVETLTVKSLVRRLPLGMLNTQYYFCDALDCEVVYFPLDTRAPLFRRGDLLVRVGAKEKEIEQTISICYCFGFTRSDIENEVAETGSSAITEQIRKEVKAGNCACEVKNPSGKCCLADVTRTVRNALSRKGESEL